MLSCLTQTADAHLTILPLGPHHLVSASPYRPRTQTKASAFSALLANRLHLPLSVMSTSPRTRLKSGGAGGGVRRDSFRQGQAGQRERSPGASGTRTQALRHQAEAGSLRAGSLTDQPALLGASRELGRLTPVQNQPQGHSRWPYPIAELNSSVAPTASNTWSSFDLLSPVKVLENPVKKCLATQVKILKIFLIYSF